MTEAPRPAPSQPRVFMLEDDAAVVRLVRESLERAGFSFQAAERAAGALDRARAFAPDLVLLDVQLPDGDGYSVCAALRADPALRAAPVLFLTQQRDLQSRLRGFAAGAQDFLSKPFDVEEMLARVRAQLQLKQSRDAEARRNADLAQREDERREWAHSLVHDLRSPLGSIKLTLDLLAGSGTVRDPDLARLVRNADAATDYLLFLVNDLLDLDAGRLEVHLDPVDPKALLDRLSDLCAASLRSRRQTLKITAQPAPELRSDELLLFRSLANLLTNAIKFSPEEAVIELDLARRAGATRFSVRDQGPGVPDDEKERIFEKYYRGKDAVQKAAPGSGIGLAFCRLAARTLGGTVWVEDAAGGGSRFVLELPDAAPAGAAPVRADPEELFGAKLLDEYRTLCAADLDAAQAQARLLPAKGADAAESIKRVAHRLCGSAGTYGFPRASRLAQELEKKLDVLLEEEARLDDAVAQAVLRALSELRRELLP